MQKKEVDTLLIFAVNYGPVTYGNDLQSCSIFTTVLIPV